MLIHLKKIITNHDREYIYIAAVYNINNIAFKSLIP
jgi:hypothetical protein